MEFKPHNYQSFCVDRILAGGSLGLFLDMGLGKTVITLTAIEELRYNRFQIGKTLVIAPKKVAEDTWAREASKWDHLKRLRIVPCLGSEAKRIKALDEPGDVYVINRENVSWLVSHYRNRWPFRTVVIDELSSFKNPKAQRFKAMKSILPLTERVLGLTGTPSPNGLEDLWGQIFLLDKGERLGKTVTSYRSRYFDQRWNGWGYDPKQGALESIRGKISDICISLKSEDYLELPDLVEDVRKIRMGPNIEKQYKQFERDLFLEINEEELDAGSAAVLSGKLLQFCNGAVYTDGESWTEIHDAKIEAFQEMVEELDGKPALVFYSFKHDLVRIKAALKGIVVRELKSTKDIEDWNNGKIQVALAHPASAAYGLNLQDGGNHIIWFGLSWSLELYQQAVKRLHRQGQKEKVINHILVMEGKRDEDVMEVLAGKSQTQEALLESLKARIRQSKNGGV